MLLIYKLAFSYSILILLLIMFSQCSENIKLDANIKVTASAAKNTEKTEPKEKPAKPDSSSFSDTYENFSVGMKKSDVQSQINNDKATFSLIKPETAEGSFFGLSNNSYDQQYELIYSQNDDKESLKKVVFTFGAKKVLSKNGRSKTSNIFLNKAFKISFIYNHNDFELINNRIINLFGEPTTKSDKLSVWKSDLAELKIINMKNNVAVELFSLEYKKQLESIWNEDK